MMSKEPDFEEEEESEEEEEDESTEESEDEDEEEEVEVKKKVTKKKLKKKKETYILKEVVTQKDIGIGKLDNDEIFTDKDILLEILNKLDKIEKGILWLA